jgi:hypothetical protein
MQKPVVAALPATTSVSTTLRQVARIVARCGPSYRISRRTATMFWMYHAARSPPRSR